MVEAFIGFLIGVLGTYLAMTQHDTHSVADDLRVLLRDLKQEETRAASE